MSELASSPRPSLTPKRQELAALLLVVLVGGFFLFYNLAQLPTGLDGEFIEDGTAGFSLVLSRQTGVPPDKVMGLGAGLAKSWRETTLIRSFIFEQYPMGHPLSGLLMYIVFSLFGPSVLAMNAMNASVGFLAVVATYLLGRAMFGRLEGIVAAILMSSSLSYLIVIRTGIPRYALTVLTVVLAIYLFYLAHKHKKRRHLWLAAAAFSLSGLMAWVGIIVVTLILASFFALYVLIYLGKVALSLMGRYAVASPRLGLESRTALDKAPKDVPPSPIQRGWRNALRVYTPLFEVIDYLGFAAIAAGLALLITTVYSTYTLVLASFFALYAAIYLVKGALSLTGRYAVASRHLGLVQRPAFDKDSKGASPSLAQPGWRDALRVSTPLFGPANYLGFAAIAAGLALLITTAYSFYFHSPPLKSLGMIRTMLITYGGYAPVMGDNLAAFFGSFLSSMLPYTKGGDVPTSTMPGQPMIYPTVAVLIAMGLVACLWRRSLADNLLLIWAVVTFAIFGIFFAFRIRYVVVAAPAMYLLAATGLAVSLRLLRRVLARLNPSIGYQRTAKGAVWVLAGLLVVPSLLSTYQQFFLNFPSQGINRTRWHGQAQVAEYFLKNADPSAAQVVFWEYQFQPYVFFFFSAQGKPYPVVYWNDLGGYVTGEKDKWKDESVVPPWDANLRNKMRQWEESLIAQGKTIYYVAPVNITYERDWEFNGGPEEQVRQNERLRGFQDLHPNLQPLLTVDYLKRGPHFAIYAVDKETPAYYALNAGNGSESIVNTKEANRIKVLRIKGTVREPAISLGASTLKLPVTLSGDDDLAITFDRNSTLTQTRLAQNYPNEAADHQNLVYKEGVAPFLRWLELENPTGDFQTQHEGYLVYKIESPGAITKLTVASYPRVYNDTDRRNSVAMLYSLDGVNYRPVYEVTSDGNGKDLKIEERKDEIEASGRAIYIKFVFKGHGNPLATGYPTTVQLWSTTDKPMTFAAQVDTSSLAPLVLAPGANSLKFAGEGTGGTAAVTLAFDGPVTMDAAR